MKSLLIGKSVMVKEQLSEADRTRSIRLCTLPNGNDPRWKIIESEPKNVYEMPDGFTWGKRYKIQDVLQGAVVLVDDNGQIQTMPHEYVTVLPDIRWVAEPVFGPISGQAIGRRYRLYPEEY